MTFDDFEAAIEEIKNYVESTGDEIVEEDRGIQEVNHQGERYTLGGIRCVHGDNTYFVGGHEELPYFHIVYPLSIVQNIANSLPEGFGDQLSLEHVQFEGTPQVRAAVKLLNQVPREEMDAFVSYLFLVASGGSVACSLQHLDSGAIGSFHTEKKIYPNESDMTLHVFSDAVQSVITHGVRGAHAVGRSIDLEVDEDNPEESDLTLSAGY